MKPTHLTSILLSLVLSLPVFGTAGAQEIPKVTLEGQVRPRGEARSPVDGSWDSFVSMRVRAALRAEYARGVKLFVQLQDVRYFGEEANTLGDFQADNLDLHQGFLELPAVPVLGGMVRAGRQEVALGEQRLVGAVNWTQQGRSFDGVRYSRSKGHIQVDLLGMKLSEATSPARDHDADFFGAWGILDLERYGKLELFGLATRDAREEGADELTTGGLWRGEAGPVDLRAEASFQGGNRGEEDVSAYLFAFRAGTSLPGAGTITLWYDHLSGDDDPGDGKSKVFDTLFATNHAFYGFADYFLNIPLHTGGLGLTDGALKTTFTPRPGTSLGLDLHYFRTAEKGTLSTRNLGTELDLTLGWAVAPGLRLSAGYSYFAVEEGMKELGRLSEDAHWLYLMLDAGF